MRKTFKSLFLSALLTTGLAIGNPGALGHSQLWLMLLIGLVANLFQPSYRAIDLNAPEADRGTATQILWSICLVQLLSVVEAVYFRYPDSFEWDVLTGLALAVMVLGLALRTWGVITLGSFFTWHVTVQEKQSVIRTGPYRWIRHPGYAGALLTYLFAPVFLHAWISLVLAVVIIPIAFIRRIRLEERVMMKAFGSDYESYQRETAALMPFLCRKSRSVAGELVLNDIHSRLNETSHQEVLYPDSVADVISVVERAGQEGRAISISGSRHAMGGQQFGTGTVHLSMKRMSRVLSFDDKQGLISVEAGIEWPELIEYLLKEQKGQEHQWGIVQKQTGADRLSIGGALAANVHGRGVKFKPIIQDVEAFTLVNADGQILRVSRQQNQELFSLAIGGYGLFGVIVDVDLRLQMRSLLERVVEVTSVDELPEKTRQKLEEGYTYGDFQYKTDESAEDFMRTGIFSAYRPVPIDSPVTEEQKELSSDNWNELIVLAHTDKARAFEVYSSYYLSTNGQIYWSDTHQLSYYNSDFIEYVHRTVPDYPKSSLMITELYVPRERLNAFVELVIADAREHDLDIVFGTMRLIEKDDESFLAWAKSDYACIIFNIEVAHSEKGLTKAESDFRRLIDRALSLDGSFFLTYHRWATKEQILSVYPQFSEFLTLKLKYDPLERFQSDWYRHYRDMFSEDYGGLFP